MKVVKHPDIVHDYYPWLPSEILLTTSYDQIRWRRTDGKNGRCATEVLEEARKSIVWKVWLKIPYSIIMMHNDMDKWTFKQIGQWLKGEGL